MNKIDYAIDFQSLKNKTIDSTDNIPHEVKEWVKSLPLNQRRYVLAVLRNLILASSRETPENFNDCLADSLASKILQDRIPQQLVKKYLRKFNIHKELNEGILKNYIQQFYVHCAQDLRTQSDNDSDVSSRLFSSLQERTIFFNYIVGFEILKMLFRMSWLQHERLYQLQKNQESFLKTYIKPIQYAHRINGIIVPKYEHIFFAKRSYFIEKPKITEKKLVELVIATFTRETVSTLGFLIIHHFDFLIFDYDYIFNYEPEYIFIV
ncbi:MAG TPA: hypothetical protein V6D33_03865 [Cyanophyceae cyanobacterium]